MERNTKNDIEKMQQDAKERIKEMQRRSMQYDLNTDIPPVPNFVQVGNQRNRQRNTGQSQPQSRENINKPTEQERPEIVNKSANSDNRSLKKGFDLLKLFNFNNFKLDNDILVIVVLILLLSSEEADELLLMALLYIML